MSDTAVKARRLNMIEAINEALHVMMERDPNVVVFGEDIGYFGGVFRATAGLQKAFGKTRVFDTPINECGIIGAAVGMGAYGLRPVPEIQFADYIYPGLDQLISEAARLRYRSAGRIYRADHRAQPVWRRHLWRADPQSEPGGTVHSCGRAENGDPQHTL
jgi:deoxyxylulose-5-phosphate synthase